MYVRGAGKSLRGGSVAVLLGSARQRLGPGAARDAGAAAVAGGVQPPRRSLATLLERYYSLH